MEGMEYTVPDKYCPKCGDRIPVAGDSYVSASGEKKLRKIGLIAREGCAKDAGPSKPRVFRRRSGEHHEQQDTILTNDCPTIRL